MRIFISHSTAKGNAAGKQRLEALKAALEQGGASPGHEVLLDFERLEPGSKWRSVLDEWMACCHSAVLMLDPVALKSPWVLKEATILAHRAALDPAFLLFPALLDGVKREDLSASDSPFSKLYLDAIQRLPKTDPAGIADAVKLELGKLAAAPVTPMETLAAKVAAQLRNGDPVQLEAIGARLTGQPIQWSNQESRAARCGHEIARAIVRGERGGYRTLRDLIAALRTAGLTKEAAETTLNCAAPLWVAGPAAAPLADLAQRNLGAVPAAGIDPSCWATALNGAYVPGFTAEMYLRRAFLPGRETFCSIEGGESDARAEELIARIRSEVHAREPVLRAGKVEAADRYLSRLTTPYFILLPPPVPDVAVLRMLQTKYPRVTFILHTGEELLPGGGDWPARVVPLEPPVDLDQEQLAAEDYSRALDDIGRT
jgi:hypothetical protein